MKPRLTGIYAITPDDWELKPLIERVEELCCEGICALQYRRKATPAPAQLAETLELLQVCKKFNVPFIVNDSLELALATGADGLHIGASDGNPHLARQALGANRYLGVSCYNRLPLAIAASEVADYVGFGAVFPSTTKPRAIRADLTLFSQARTLGIATVAIGGITRETVDIVISAGADAAAMISGLFDSSSF